MLKIPLCATEAAVELSLAEKGRGRIKRKGRRERECDSSMQPPLLPTEDAGLLRAYVQTSSSWQSPEVSAIVINMQPWLIQAFTSSILKTRISIGVSHHFSAWFKTFVSIELSFCGVRCCWYASRLIWNNLFFYDMTMDSCAWAFTRSVRTWKDESQQLVTPFSVLWAETAKDWGERQTEEGKKEQGGKLNRHRKHELVSRKTTAIAE